jgi:hypothetical protein
VPERIDVADLAFPDFQYLPSIPAKLTKVAAIAYDIAGALGLPERSVGLRRNTTPATGVHMPVASVNVDNLPELRKYDIGCPRKIPAMEAKAKTQSVGDTTDNHFRFGVLPPDG